MIRLGRPLQRGVVFNELARKAVHDIPCLDPLGNAAPAEMVGDDRRSRGAPCEKVRKTEEVQERQIAYVDGGITFDQMNEDIIARDWNRPEDTGWADTRIKIMDLI